VRDFIARSNAQGCIGLPEDIRAAVAALLSNDPRWANGTLFDISSGQ
jgi:hypothetical protein